jgi:hypothetical protein
MKELFRERDLTQVGYCQSILEAEGIPTVIRNESLTGLTEFPIPDFFPALCVVDEADYDRAIQVLRERLARDEAESGEEIPCAACGEVNPANFEVCWSCGGAVREQAGGGSL